MLPDWVSNPGPLTYESGALPIALRSPAQIKIGNVSKLHSFIYSELQIRGVLRIIQRSFFLFLNENMLSPLIRTVSPRWF